jgi:hypothetical protein
MELRLKIVLEIGTRGIRMILERLRRLRGFWKVDFLLIDGDHIYEDVKRGLRYIHLW